MKGVGLVRRMMGAAMAALAITPQRTVAVPSLERRVVPLSLFNPETPLFAGQWRGRGGRGRRIRDGERRAIAAWKVGRPFAEPCGPDLPKDFFWKQDIGAIDGPDGRKLRAWRVYQKPATGL